ncbi:MULTISPECIES: hypothetical protein [unclassified Pseudoxanthomonas]
MIWVKSSRGGGWISSFKGDARAAAKFAVKGWSQSAGMGDACD